MKQMAISFGIGATLGAGFSGAFVKAGDAITGVNKRIGDLEKQKLSLADSISKLNQKLDPEKFARWSEELKKTEENIRSKKESLDILKNSLNSQGEVLKSLNREYSSSNSELLKLKETYKENERSHKSAEAVLEKESLVIKEVERNIKNLSSEIKSNGDSTGELKLKQDNLKVSLEELKKGYHNKKIELVNSKEALDKHNSSIKDATEKNKNLKSQVEKTKDENGKLRTEYNKQDTELKKLENSYKKNSEEHRKAKENMSAERKEVEKLTKEQEKLNSQIERGARAKALYSKSNAINAAANKVSSMGNQAIVAGGVVSAPIIASVQTAISHQAAFADVEKMFDFENKDEEIAFREKINQMITDEKLSVTVEELYAGVAAIGQAGIKNKEEALQYARLGVKTGIAFEMQKDQAIAELVSLRSMFKLTHEGLDEFTDQINTLGAITGASASDIVDYTKRLGNIGESAGMSKAQTSAIGAVLMEMGLESNRAATGMKNLLTSTTSGEFASKGDRQVLRMIGFTPEKLSRDMQKDGEKTFLKIFERISKLDSDRQLAVMQQLFGKEALSSATNINGGIEKLTEVLSSVQNKEVYGGSKEREYAIKSQTLEAKIVNLQNQMKIAQSKIGEALFPEIESAVENFNKLLDKVNKFRIANPEAFSSIVKGVTYATAGLIGLGTAMKLLSPVIKLYGFGVKVAGFLTEKAVGEKIVTAFIKADIGIRNFVSSSLNNIGKATTATTDFISKSSIAIKKYTLSALSSIKSSAISAGIYMKKMALETALSLKKMSLSALGTMKTATASIVGSMKVMSASVVGALKTAGISMKSFALATLGSMKTVAISVAGAMKTVSLSIVGSLKVVGVALAKFGVALLANPITWYVAGVMALVGAGYLLYKNWDKVKDTFSKVASAGKELWDKIPNWGKYILTATNPMVAMVRVGNWIYENWDLLISKGQEMLEAITLFFGGMGESASAFKERFTAIKDGIFDSWKEKIDSWKNLFRDAIDSVVEKLNNSFLGKVWSAGVNMLSGNKDEIPGFAEGGIVTSPTLAWVGEGGSSESIIPHDGSDRSRGLWEKTGRLIGAFDNNNGNTSFNDSISFTYAPVIHAQDATGVEIALQKDREISLREFERYYDRMMSERKRRGNGR